MKKTLQPNYVEANGSARAATFIVAVVFFVTGMFLSLDEASSNQLGTSQLFALSVLALLMLASAVYSLYLVVNSFGTGGFPGPAAKLPARSRISYGLTAVVYRGVMIVSALFLIVFPLVVVRYAGWF